MKIGIVIDTIKYWPASVRNYTENILDCFSNLNTDDLEIVLIPKDTLHSKNSIINQGIKGNKLKIWKYISIFPASMYRIDIPYKYNHLDVIHYVNSRPPLNFGFHNSKQKVILTQHGISPVVCPKYSNIKERLINYIIKLQINKIDSIITVSESEKRELVKYYRIPEEKVSVIYHGIDNDLFKQLPITIDSEEFLSEKYSIASNFILHVSSYHPIKNLLIILKSYLHLKKEGRITHKLVIAGYQNEDIDNFIMQNNLKNNVLLLGYVDKNDLQILYNAATCFVFPSFHESFGMPLIEAMACGCPVVTSNTYSGPEITQDAAILIDPSDIDDISSGILSVINDENLRNQLIEKGLKRAKDFSWEKCAKEHIEVYTNVYLKAR